MQNKELNVLDIPKWGRYLRGKWVERFAANLTKKQQKEIYVDQFLWHLCSYEKVECLEKEEAIKAFEKKHKKQCTIFYQFSDDAYLVRKAKNLTVDDLPRDEWTMDYQDLYVMDHDLQWTFILTHENGWIGPYFIDRTNQMKEKGGMERD